MQRREQQRHDRVATARFLVRGGLRAGAGRRQRRRFQGRCTYTYTYNEIFNFLKKFEFYAIVLDPPRSKTRGFLFARRCRRSRFQPVSLFITDVPRFHLPLSKNRRHRCLLNVEKSCGNEIRSRPDETMRMRIAALRSVE